MTPFSFPARVALVLSSIAIPAAVSAAGAPAQPGMTVVRDAATGKLRAPTAAELRALRNESGQAQRAAADSARPPTVRADGVKAATLGERGMVYSVITRGPDGKLHEHCVEGEAAANHTAQQGHQHGKKGADHE